MSSPAQALAPSAPDSLRVLREAPLVLEVPGIPTPQAFDAFRRRPLVFPAQPATRWEDIHRLWFGDGPVPLLHFHVMWGCGPEVDQEIKAKFEPLWHRAVAGELADWDDDPRACFAKMLLIDQLSRHIFRGQPNAFAHDPLARQLSLRCQQHMANGHAYHIEEALLMAWPFIHSEVLEELLFAQGWLDTLVERSRGTPYFFRMLLHQYGVSRHVRVVRRFGRYPHRNRLLGREATPEEQRYMAKEAESWELDHYPESRGGTWRYQLKTLGYGGRMFYRFARNGHLGLTLRALWLYLTHSSVRM